MYKLKTIAQKGIVLSVAAVLVTASLPPIQALAYNELNPLTERSLLLSSSAPGFVNTDGSGNSTDSPNPTGEAYAPAGTGPNGMKTGQTFSFKVSTDSVAADRPVRAFTFQYCTEAAGYCQAPGTNEGDARDETRETNAIAHPLERSDLSVNYTSPVAGEDFDIYLGDSETPTNTGWSMTTDNVEDIDHSGRLSGKHNYITLHSEEGISPEFDEQIRIVFKADEDNHITNPGGGSFFVKINTFDSDDTEQHIPGGTSNIDGGVTVANMMTDSIHITTKVLETMSFSVGIELPEMGDGISTVYQPCKPIDVVNNNRIDLGNEDAENSLETTRAYEQQSFWRIQSNSSGGATVYYSGDTLRNTVGDSITPSPVDGAESLPGSEQFGLALVSAENDMHENYEQAIVDEPEYFSAPTIAPLSASAPYSLEGGEGNIRDLRGEDAEGNDTWLDEPGVAAENFAEFAFNTDSMENPEQIAQGSNVLSCTTGKMRYIGNIGADTPAGVYTTKINYLAAPQY